MVFLETGIVRLAELKLLFMGTCALLFWEAASSSAATHLCIPAERGSTCDKTWVSANDVLYLQVLSFISEATDWALVVCARVQWDFPYMVVSLRTIIITPVPLSHSCESLLKARTKSMNAFCSDKCIIQWWSLSLSSKELVIPGILWVILKCLLKFWSATVFQT